MKNGKLTHFDKQKKAKMVDVSSKKITNRTASAYCKVITKPETIELLKKQKIEKGDTLTIAKIAGILSAKNTSLLIPLTHQINLDNVDIDFKINKNYIEIISYVKTAAKTGVEMEALISVCISALTIYDMLKAVDKEIMITDIKLLSKSGGKKNYESKI